MIRENESTTRKPSSGGTGDQQTAIVGAEVQRGIDAGRRAPAPPPPLLPPATGDCRAFARRRRSAIAKPRIIVHSNVFPPAVSRPTRNSVFTETLAATGARAQQPSHRTMPNQALSPPVSVVYLEDTANPRKTGHFGKFQMQDHTSPSSLENAIALQKYGVGQPVRRKEDDTLVRGKGKYTDDFSFPGRPMPGWCAPATPTALSGASTRSAAKAMPGVLGVWTGADLAAAGYGPFTCGLPLKSRDGTPLLQTNRTALDDRQGALCRRSRSPLSSPKRWRRPATPPRPSKSISIRCPRSPTPRRPRKPGAPQLYDHIPNNVALDYHYRRHRQDRRRLRQRRACDQTRHRQQPRRGGGDGAARGARRPTTRRAERFTLQVPTQGVAGNSVDLAKNILNVPTEKVRILTANVGGSFGMKNANYPEYTCILHAAKALGAPGEMDRRTLDQLSVRQPRPRADDPCRARARCRGQVPGRSASGYGNLGAYITGVAPRPLSLNTGKNLASVYRTPLMASTSRRC